MNFVQKFAISRDVYLVWGREAGFTPCYFYIEVEKGMRQAFRNIDAAADVDLSQYGTIVASGYGSIPKAIEAEMALKYGS